MEIIVLRNTYRQVLTVPQKGALHLSDQLSISQTDGGLTCQSGEKEIPLNTDISIGELVVYPQSDNLRRYSIDGLSRVVVGTQAGSDLLSGDEAVTLLLTKADEGSWQLQNLGAPIYLNNHLITQNQALPFGAELAFGNSCIKVFPKEIWVSGSVKNATLLEVADSTYQYYEDYPDYHRSPRLIYHFNEDRMTVNAPPQEPNKPRNELLRMLVPPLVMIGVVILITVFQPRGLYILMAVAMSIVTAIFSVQNYFRNKREYKQSLADRISAYRAYLSDKAIQLTKLSNTQRRWQSYHYPTIQELDTLVQDLSRRIYEKIPQDVDFLYYRLGLGEIPTSYRLDYSQKERSGVKDPLEVEGFALYESHKTLVDMPVLANLKNGPVGYVGERSLVLEQLQLLVHQLAVFHSYHDVQFITIMPEAEKDQWQWMRWLPHATLQDVNVRGFVYNERTRDQILNRLMETLRQRELQQKEAGANQELIYLPHYVVLVTDATLITDHVIMEFFAKDPTALGCSLIFVQATIRSLPENVQTVIHLKDQATGELVMEERRVKEQTFALDHFPENYDKERISRRLAPLNHLETLQSAIPESVTFLELYQVATVEELGVFERWQSHSPHQSMAVPLGLRGVDDYVKLDLHERAHGPHGLIAGTTGSGKSELIQSYILSLAVNFHPHDVAFLLIDYKGGGMANLFKDLPHVLGTITNLDGNQSMRALASIKAENERRQRLFAEADVNHIHAYQKKYKQGEVPEPLPHLIIISDEFAELKNEQPDFITQLVSTARIGRSLGVNLILATQKPAGVVNDQIWSNSNFRIALKVADKADSQEMLHTPDAATINQAGRAYLQVGNNEVYELFQSAWSGADYHPDKEDQGIDDQTIFAINELGQYEALNQDLSGLDEAIAIRKVPTELEAVVQHIQQVTQEKKIVQLAQPWLPPLSTEIFVQDLRPDRFQDLWQGDSRLEAIVGMVDIPSEQRQTVGTYQLADDGNLAIFGGPAMGKSTLLQTIVMDLSRQNTPEQVHFYIFDFGTSALYSLKNLPHTADFITSDQEEKLTKFIELMKREIQSRKRLFNRHNVNSKEMYQIVTGEALPQIIMVVDNYEGYRDIQTEQLRNGFDTFTQTLARDGNSLGITIIVSGGRLAAIRPVLLANFKTRLSLKLTDESEIKTIMGHFTMSTESIAGRGLIMIEEVEVFQAALSHRGATPVQRLQELRKEISQMDQFWQGDRPAEIPIVPEEISLAQFMERADTKNAIAKPALPLGLDVTAVETIALDFSTFRHLVVFSDNSEQIRLMVDRLIATVSQSSWKITALLLDVNGDYQNYESKVSHYVNDPTLLSDMTDFMVSEIKNRETNGWDQYCTAFIPDLESYEKVSGLSQTELAVLMTRGPRVGFFIIVGTTYSYLVSINPVPKYLKENGQYHFIGMKLIDQNFLDKTYNSKERHPAMDEAYIHNRKTYYKLKLSRNITEETF